MDSNGPDDTVHVQDALNLRILHIFEGTSLLDMACSLNLCLKISGLSCSSCC